MSTQTQIRNWLQSIRKNDTAQRGLNWVDGRADDLIKLGLEVNENFQRTMETFGAVLIGALMILYVGGYPGGVLKLTVDLITPMINRGVSFETAWLALGLGIYMLFSIWFIFTTFILRINEDEPGQMAEQIDQLCADSDSLRAEMIKLTEKIDELKLHL